MTLRSARRAALAAGMVAAVVSIACPGAIALTLKVRKIPIASRFGCCWQIASGPDNAVWATEETNDVGHIARITPAGSVTQFSLANGSPSWPTGIAAGPDGDVWFTNSDGWSIGRLTTTGAFQEYRYSQLGGTEATGSFPGWAGEDVAFASDGALWSTPWSTAVIGDRIVNDHLLLRASPAEALSGGAVTFSVPGNPVIMALTRGPDGDIWFTQTGPAGVGRITATGQVTQYLTPFPSADGLVALTAGADGNLWIVDDGQVGRGFTRIARMTPQGAVSWFPVPNDPGEVGAITSGSDGNVWFTSREGFVGRITPSGSILEFSLPIGSNPQRIVTGPDGNLWFIDPLNSAVETFAPRVPCQVPRLVGLTRAQALAAVAGTVCEIGHVSGAGPRGEVHSQRPAAGTTVPTGTKIKLTLGSPSTLEVSAPRRTKVPSVVHFTVRGHAIGGGYRLDLAFNNHSCAADAASEEKRTLVYPSPPRFHGTFTVTGGVRVSARATYYICAYLTVAGYTTARASASYVSG